MLNKLFGSEQKIKILSYFFSSDNKGFLSKEISRSLEQKGPTVKRDLNALVDLGILKMQSSENDQKDLIKNEEVKEEDVLKSHRKNEDKYNLKKEKSRIKKDKFEEKYYLNTQNLLYPELKSLFEKIKFLANQEIFDKIIETCKPKIFVLVGKFVNDFDSPIDVLIIGDFSKKKFLNYISQLETNINEEVNYTILSEEEYFYRQTISDIFLYQIMERKNITLCG